MLILQRKAGEAMVLNGVITIRILEVSNGAVKRVKIGIDAPPSIIVLREELLDIASDPVSIPARNGGDACG